MSEQGVAYPFGLPEFEAAYGRLRERVEALEKEIIAAQGPRPSGKESITKVLAILGDPRPGAHVTPHEHRVWQAEKIVALFDPEILVEGWPDLGADGNKVPANEGVLPE